MSYTSRQAAMKDSADMAQRVAYLGEAQGLWTITQDRREDHCHSYIEVKDAGGLTFCIMGGQWALDGKVAMNVAQVREGAFSAARGTDHEARASVSRGAAAIVKEFTRRVVNNEDARKTARKLLDNVKAQKDAHAQLVAHVETMKAMGVDIREVDPKETYKATGYLGSGSYTRVSVNSAGEVAIDALSIPVDKLPALLALLRA